MYIYIPLGSICYSAVVRRIAITAHAPGNWHRTEPFALFDFRQLISALVILSNYKSLNHIFPDYILQCGAAPPPHVARLAHQTLFASIIHGRCDTLLDACTRDRLIRRSCWWILIRFLAARRGFGVFLVLSLSACFYSNFIDCPQGGDGAVCVCVCQV